MNYKSSDLICGLDECGRGAWAGPLVASAVVLGDMQIKITRQLKDSKELTKRKRNQIYKLIMKHAMVVEIEVISALRINNQGIGWANKEVFKRLIKRIDAEKYIVDG